MIICASTYKHLFIFYIHIICTIFRQKKCITHTTQQPILPMPMVDSSTTCGTMLFLLKIRIPKINNNSNKVTNSQMVNNKETNTTTTTIRPTMVKKKKDVGVRDLSLKYVRITQCSKMCVRDF